LRPLLSTSIELRAGERRAVRVTLGPDEFEVELAGRIYVPSALEPLERADVRLLFAAPTSEELVERAYVRLLFAAPTGEARARSVVLLRSRADDRPGAASVRAAGRSWSS
jgi:hypothetical protein